MKRLKVAVIGAGRLGGFHAHKLVGAPNVELVAVVDTDAAARERLAAECNTAAVADHRALAGKIDAAVVAAPTRLHHAIALDLLEAKTHLLVEKPLCSTTREADELIDAARRRQVVLQVGHVERFNPAVAAAAPHVRNPKYIEAVRASGFTFRSTDVGVVLDLMIHDIDLVLSMVHSRLLRVDALGLSVLGGHEDVANARLEFQCGCVATLSASRIAHEAVRRMNIWAPRGFASLDLATRTTTLVRPSETLLRRQFHVDELTPEQVEHYKQHLSEEHLPREQKRFDAVDALALELSDFVDSILTAREPRVPGEAGRDAVAVAEQILASISTHTWDERTDGPVGPAAVPQPHILPVPHLDRPAVERKAG